MSDLRNRLNKIIDDYSLNIGHVSPYDLKDQSYFRVIDASLAKLDATPTREQIMADERVQALVKAGHNCRSFTALFAGGDESMILALREWDEALAALTESP